MLKHAIFSLFTYSLGFTIGYLFLTEKMVRLISKHGVSYWTASFFIIIAISKFRLDRTEGKAKIKFQDFCFLLSIKLGALLQLEQATNDNWYLFLLCGTLMVLFYGLELLGEEFKKMS
ncbi:hypothetical protein CL634_07845 [bacterium]|nr:hypothetical protein [bacterium]|tara:strand:- start:839 stop:1192 length:354 start_codon:yes stop_codon:yes gene_type:complete